MPYLYCIRNPYKAQREKTGGFARFWRGKRNLETFVFRAEPGAPRLARARPGTKDGRPLHLARGRGKRRFCAAGARRALPLKQKMGHTALPCVFWAFVCFASTAGYAIMKKTGPRGGIIQPCARKKGGELPCFVRTAGRTLRGTSAFARAAGPVWRRQVPPGRAGSSLPPPPRLARRRAGSSLPPPSRLERHRAGSSPFMAAMRQAGRHGL